MFIHDILKIKYSREGFLPDWPYHLISDEEMFEAFLNDTEECYFKDTYPCPDDVTLEFYWDEIVAAMKYHISQCLDESVDTDVVPDWVYSYMLGAVIGPNSELYDIHDMLVLLELDNVEDELNDEIYSAIYEISDRCVKKLAKSERYALDSSGNEVDMRPPTIFGEPHVIKQLRLDQN